MNSGWFLWSVICNCIWFLYSLDTDHIESITSNNSLLFYGYSLPLPLLSNGCIFWVSYTGLYLSCHNMLHLNCDSFSNFLIAFGYLLNNSVPIFITLPPLSIYIYCDVFAVTGAWDDVRRLFLTPTRRVSWYLRRVIKGSGFSADYSLFNTALTIVTTIIIVIPLGTYTSLSWYIFL
jgi:hypothetical protein